MPMTRSIQEQMVLTNFRPSGFDYMRIVLALSVIVWHAGAICLGNQFEITYGLTYFAPIPKMIVPMFFTLSGFLVAGSLERSKTLVSFMGLRGLRIAPALAVEVLVSALILGPIFTTLPLGDYFASPVFHKYFWNLVGEIHYYLPGVFETNPNTMVNGQLWTVPFELICYIVLAGMFILGIFKRPSLMLGLMALAYAAQVLNTIYRPHTDVTGPTGSTVVMSFLAGLLVYRYREKLPWSAALCVLMLVASYMILLIPNGSRFVILPVAYATVYLGLLNPPRNKVLLSGDYSYGVYLFGFPLQQMLFAAHPLFREWQWNMVGSVVTSVTLAVISWWLIEKPCLTHRDKLYSLENWYLRQPWAGTLRKALGRLDMSGSR